MVHSAGSWCTFRMYMCVDYTVHQEGKKKEYRIPWVVRSVDRHSGILCKANGWPLRTWPWPYDHNAYDLWFLLLDLCFWSLQSALFPVLVRWLVGRCSLSFYTVTCSSWLGYIWTTVYDMCTWFSTVYTCTIHYVNVGLLYGSCKCFEWNFNQKYFVNRTRISTCM